MKTTTQRNRQPAVTPITSEQVAALRVESGSMGPDISEARIGAALAGRQKPLQQYCEEALSGTAFIVSWRGNRTPSGAAILGFELAHARHGLVKTADGVEFGVYERLSPDGIENRMIVHSNGQIWE